QVYDAGKDATDEHEVSYIVMEYVSGGDLKEMMEKEGPLSGKELSKIGASLAAGLAHAHERGVIHRDIKPQNVLIDEHGRPKLTDFGIARAIDESREAKTGSYLGTTLYSSPEQLQGEAITAGSDVYSLGATLYEAMVGEPVFGGTVFQVASRQVHEAPVPPRERGADVSEEFEAVILACLAKDPDDRPSAAELRDALERISAGRETARLAGLPGRAGRVKLAGAALVLLLLGALAATAMLGFGGESRQADQVAERQDAPEDSEDESPVSEEVSDGEGSDALTEEAAVGLVATMYLSVVREDYEDSYAALSEGYRRREFPTRGDWRRNFADLRAITFTETPTARVSGDEAVVRGETASITNSGEAYGESGTWRLVAEDGEWKLDGMDLREQRTPGGTRRGESASTTAT
ncbi:MAG: protein kinase domain-containing protein, partial [Rubrobacteraceae bacterium]